MIPSPDTLSAAAVDRFGGPEEITAHRVVTSGRESVAGAIKIAERQAKRLYR